MSRLAMLTTDSFYFSSCVGYTLHYPHVDMWNDSTYPKAREVHEPISCFVSPSVFPISFHSPSKKHKENVIYILTMMLEIN